MGKKVIHNLFFEAADKYRDNIVFHYFDQNWKEVTYNELLESTKGIASYFIKNGIRKGDKIAIISENRPEWCASYLAISLSGGIAVPIDAQLGLEEIRNLLADSESKVVFHSLKTGENIKKALNDLVTQVNFDSPEFKDICRTQEVYNYPEVSEGDVASLIYTSGTTGMPKGVELTHKNLCSDAEAIIKAGIVTHRDNVLSVLPLHHTYPFMCTFLVPVFLGASITYPGGLKGPELMAAIKEMGGILVGVPRLLELIRNGIMNKIRQLPVPVPEVLMGVLRICGNLREKTGINLGKILFKSVHRPFGREFRFSTSGGANLDPEVMKDLEALGFTVLEGYGLTETSPVVTFNPITKRKAGSAGKPLPSVMMKITDPRGRETMGAMQEGEITIKGPMVMKGYYRNPELTKQVMREGWFLSGDLGYMDEDGYLFITGRLKDVIVLSSGENVYPEDVERQYMKIPLIKEICVVGIDEKGIVESLHAVIVPDIEYAKRARIGNLLESLKWEINNVSLHMPQYLRIKGFTLYPEPLPKTPLGKFRRFMIKDLIRVRREELKVKREEDKRLTKDEIGRKVVECIKPLLKERISIQVEDNLDLDLGLDSLARLELVVSLEKAFSIKLPESFASEMRTVEELLTRIKEYGVRGEGEIEKLPMWKDILKEEPGLEDKKKVGLYHTFLQKLIVMFILMVIKGILRVFFRLKFRGLEHLLERDPYIIAPNHVSYIDGFAIVAALPLKLFWDLYSIGLQMFFTGRLGFFAKLAHVIPIDRETYLQKALQMASYVLRKEKSLMIFPEGGRSYDGELMEFKKGVGILALELNIPVIPAYIKGSFEALPRGRMWPKFHEISITFGKPLYPADVDMSRKPEGMDGYQFFVNELRERVKGLKSI
ncbi:MAG: AMP-binding protein [Nitrospirota bacterium]